MGRVQGKVAFITGVARGQGRSHAVRLAEEGADIIGIDAMEDEPFAPYRLATQDDMDETITLVEKTGQRMVGIKADVRDRAPVIEAVNTGVNEFGAGHRVRERRDLAGGWHGVGDPARRVERRHRHQSHRGVQHSRSDRPGSNRRSNGGSIILTSSGAGLKYVPNLVQYNSAKAAVVAIAKTLSNELAAQQIRVNVIAPGTVNTALVTENKAMFKLFRPDLDEPTIEDAEPVFTMMMPMGKPWVEPVDVSNAVLYLASDEARYVTGVVLPVGMGILNRA